MARTRWVAMLVALCAVGFWQWTVYQARESKVHRTARFRPEVEFAGSPAESLPNGRRDAGSLDRQESDSAVDTAATTRDNALVFRGLLEDGVRRLKKFDGYTALFCKQERIRGKLHEEELIDVKIRQRPFSAYLKWRDLSQEVLYVDGRDDSKVVVRMKGVKGLLGTMRLEPASSMAMWKTRHPVTEIGLYHLATRLIAQCDRDLQAGKGYTFRRLADSNVCGRDCYAFIAEYQDQELEPLYRKSLLWIDRELHLPTAMQNFEWPSDARGAEASAAEPATLDEETFVESYSFQDVQMQAHFHAEDFDSRNEDYAFGH